MDLDKNLPIDDVEVFKLPNDFVDFYKNEDVNWGYDDLSWVTYKRTYARPLKESYLRTDKEVDPDSKEDWYQTCRRVVEGMFTIQKIHCKKNGTPWKRQKALDKAKNAYDRMFNFKWTPPGRGIWNMGTDFVFDRDGSPLNNCAFISTKNISENFAFPFAWSFKMSMLGIGVGFDTKGKNTVQIQEPSYEDKSFVIGDSREGWAEAIEKLLDAFVGDDKLPSEWDYSEIRPKGAPIKSFGGTASGPEPLKECFNRLTKMYKGYIGKNVDSRLIVDTMNMIGKCVVSGGTRRTAQISLGDKSDKQFLDLKMDQEKVRDYRWASNNSVYADIGMDYSEVAERTLNNGEPGYVWMENTRKYGRMKDMPGNKDYRAEGFNPCITKDTIIQTDKGPKKVESLIGQDFDAMVNGEGYHSEGFFKTGNKTVYRLETKNGYSIKITENHKVLTTELTQKTKHDKWKPVKSLETGDNIVLNNNRSKKSSTWNGKGDEDKGWLVGSLLGDGHFHEDGAKLEYWHDEKYLIETAIDKIKKLDGDSRYDKQRTGTYVESRDKNTTKSVQLFRFANGIGIKSKDDINTRKLITQTSSDFQVGFLRGIFDADGSVQGNHKKGCSVRLSSVRKKHLDIVQRMLLGQGINSKIYKNRNEAGTQELPDGKGGMKEYQTKELMELCISNDNLVRFKKVIGFNEESKSEKLKNLIESYQRMPNRERFVAEVESIEELGEEDVYDCNVEEVHRFEANGMVIHNCVEQPLEHGELCTLVEVYPDKHESYKDLEQTLKIAYMYGKTVTLVPTKSELTNQVMLRNRRIGCSMTGIVQAINNHGYREFFEWCDKGYEFIQKLDKKYSDWLCVPRSIKTTSVKPSGTVSLLSGSTPGVHWEHSPYYIRRMRVQDDHEILDICKEAGYPIKDDLYSDTSKVVEFPVSVSNMERSKTDVSVREKVDLAAEMQRYWSDNSVSCVTGDTVIRTSNGLNYASDFPEIMGKPDEPGVYEYNGNLKALDENNTYQNIEALIVNELEECTKINLRGGGYLKCTEDHEVRVISYALEPVWKEAANVEAGDYIVERSNYEHHTSKNQKINRKISNINISTDKRCSNDTQLPKRASEDLGEFLGMIVSDGCITTDSIKLSQIKNTAFERFIELSQNLFNVEPNIQKDNRADNLYTIAIHREEVRQWMMELGVYNDKREKSVPWPVMGGGVSMIKGFLRGVTLDGYINKDSGRVCVNTTKSWQLGNEVFQLLKFTGFQPCLLKAGEAKKDRSFSNGTYDTHQTWSVSVGKKQSKRFMKYIGFSEERKQKECKEYGNSYYETHFGEVPDYGLRDKLKSVRSEVKSKKLTNYIHSMSSYKDGSSINRDAVLVLDDLGKEIPEYINDKTYTFRKVKNTESIGEQRTYDITVSNSHSYISNGIISHNCTAEFDPDTVEARDLQRLLEAYETRLKSISFLPSEDHGYDQPPYEEISKEEYEKRVSEIDRVNKKDDLKHDQEDKFCSGKACEV